VPATSRYRCALARCLEHGGRRLTWSRRVDRAAGGADEGRTGAPRSARDTRSRLRSRCTKPCSAWLEGMDMARANVSENKIHFQRGLTLNAGERLRTEVCFDVHRRTSDKIPSCYCALARAPLSRVMMHNTKSTLLRGKPRSQRFALSYECCCHSSVCAAPWRLASQRRVG
jgi:hypothetical protein